MCTRHSVGQCVPIVSKVDVYPSFRRSMCTRRSEGQCVPVIPTDMVREVFADSILTFTPIILPQYIRWTKVKWWAWRSMCTHGQPVKKHDVRTDRIYRFKFVKWSTTYGHSDGRNSVMEICSHFYCKICQFFDPYLVVFSMCVRQLF